MVVNLVQRRFDLRGVKSNDNFSNPEMWLRLPIMATASIMLSFWLDDAAFVLMFGAYGIAVVVYATTVSLMPRYVSFGLFLWVGFLFAVTVIILLGLILYLFAYPQPTAQVLGMLLFAGETARLVSMRAMTTTFLRLELMLLILCAAGMGAVHSARVGFYPNGLIMAVSVAGFGMYLAYAVLRLSKFRDTITIVQEGERDADRLRAVGQLTGGVAHDFNNLLAVILGNLEMRNTAKNPWELEILLREAEDAAWRGADLTSQLLAFSRRSTLLPRKTSVSEICDTVTTLAARLLGDRHQIVLGIFTGLPAIYVDAGKLETLVLNLILNARDAMKDGGHIMIDASATRLLDQKTLSLWISDTGNGIEPHLLEKVFEPYFTTKPVGEGSGLDLSMARGFMEQSNGRLDLVSTVGEGTRVGLHFPVYTGDELPMPVSAA